jgi:3-methyladenine DNA glycosylase AlkD
MTPLDSWQNELRKASRPEKIAILSSFFKTKPGEYGYGDKFIGLAVPANRAIARRYACQVSESDISEMCHSEIHEFRLSGFLAMIELYRKAKTDDKRQHIVTLYLDNADMANNWDLVDLSAPYILGDHIVRGASSDILDVLSRNTDLWHQRIAIVATMALIRNGRYDETLRIAERYMSNTHPLIHKATGWMLREIGKHNYDILQQFLDCHASTMPRTALRYAIERLQPEQRKYYMTLRTTSKK